jgi:hypothetical protein
MHLINTSAVLTDTFNTYLSQVCRTQLLLFTVVLLSQHVLLSQTDIAHYPKEFLQAPYYNERTVLTPQEWVTHHSRHCRTCHRYVDTVSSHGAQYDKLSLHIQSEHAPACYGYATMPMELLPRRNSMSVKVGVDVMHKLETLWELQEKCAHSKASAAEQQQWQQYQEFIEQCKNSAVKPLYVQLFIASMRPAAK